MIIAGSGHRIERLFGDFNYLDEDFQRLVELTMRSLEELKATKIISGFAIGFDMAIASAALKLKLPLVAAVPCDNQDKLWPPKQQKQYHLLLSFADEIVEVNPGPYMAWKMMTRNQYLVDNSDHVLALFDGSAGGTKNCLEYAKKKGKPITNIWDKWKKLNENPS